MEKEQLDWLELGKVYIIKSRSKWILRFDGFNGNDITKKGLTFTINDNGYDKSYGGGVWGEVHEIETIREATENEVKWYEEMCRLDKYFPLEELEICENYSIF